MMRGLMSIGGAMGMMAMLGMLAGCTGPAATPKVAEVAEAAEKQARPADEVVTRAAGADGTVATVAVADGAAPEVVDGAAPEVVDGAAPEEVADVGTLRNGGVSLEPADGRFHVAAYRHGDMRLHLLGDQVFVSGAGGLAKLDAREERLVNVEYGLSGQGDEGMYFEGWSVISFGGLWPDNAWLTTEFDLRRDGSPRKLYRREGVVWRPQKTLEDSLRRAYPVIMNWRSGQVLGLRVYELGSEDPEDYDDDGPSRRRLERKIDRARVKLRPGFDVLGPTWAPTSMVIAPTLVPTYAATAPTGEVFLLADEGVSGSNKPRVQRWGLTGEEATAGAVDVLPAGRICIHLVVRAADEAYVGCQGKKRLYLSRFDGAAWSDEPVPKGTMMTSLAIAPDGALYMVVPSKTQSLWRRAARDSAWEPVALPEVRFAGDVLPEWRYNGDEGEVELWGGDPGAGERALPLEAVSVQVSPKGELWVVAGAAWNSRKVVLRDGASGEPLRMLADGDLMLELYDWRPAAKWSPEGCEEGVATGRSAFVALRSLPTATPRNLPEPLVERFVQEHAALMPQVERIAEVFRRGRRTVGMFVTPVDQAGADALLAALEGLAPGEKRAIECRTPRIRREFDRSTGKALQAPGF